MSKTKLLYIVAISLLISNLMLIAFIALRPHRLRGDGPQKIIERRLHFDDKQHDDYAALVRLHHKTILTKDSSVLSTKSHFYACMLTNDPAKDSLKNRLGLLQMEIEEIHFKHFLDIKNLCKPNQIADFNSLVRDIAQIFAREKLKPKH